MAPITTLLFDCDNTLVLSEDLAFEGCAELINELCALNNLDVRFTGPSLITEFVGQNFRGMLTALRTRYDLQVDEATLEDWVRREEDTVIAKLQAALQPCPGVDAQLARLARDERYKLVVVSSSAKRRVLASLAKVGQDAYFAPEHVYSAATSLPKPTSKPDPAIYLYAVEKEGVQAAHSIAIEDSKNGTLSAARAGLRVIGYIGPYEDDKRADMARVLREAGAQVIMEHWDEFPEKLAEIEKL